MTFLIMEDQLLFTIRTIRAYHFRMISYRATLTNRTGLGPKEGEVSAVHLHRDPFFSDWKVQSHSSPERFTCQRSLGESTSGEFVDKSTVNYVLPDRADRNSRLRTGLPVHYLPEGTGRDKSHRPNPRDRTGLNWVSISRRVHRTRDK